ncbi:calcium-activated potassium channel subunit beta-1 [Tachyglossus aculeatus]|uniref:calcium-activated potassium channel subunit beta-1 n=1 Tax=Tachyglossus aculeatus TaxID=9261 RepID=UPI0018F7B0FB|nr:calcium-activated potassium channel subunit beta-1 [Tachyglossus aculeatus]
MGKKLVTAQKRGETRALCLGVVMVFGSVIAYYILGTTLLPLYQKSVWSQVSKCHLIEADIKDQEELAGRSVPQYPCLWVNVTALGKWAMLYHTEETKEKNHQCSYIPTHLENYRKARLDVEKIKANFKEHQAFLCYHDPEENERSVLYMRLYGPQVLFSSLFWPTFMLIGGVLIIIMVKINQSLSVLVAQH